MESVLDLLVRIQNLDDEVEKAESRLAQIPQERAKLENQIKAKAEELKNSESRIQELKKSNKLKEIEIADNEGKIAKLNTQTFAVKTNEEYRALLKEVEFLKHRNHDIEDEMLGIMEEEEKIRSSINQIRIETEEYIAKAQTRIADLDKESELLKEKQTVAKVDLENNFSKLPDDVKELYNRIAKFRGKAVCLIIDNTCTGCFANLTHQFLNELKKGNKILLCDNCGRILVYRDSKT
jgi:predicted  nucleic acid-binding Zn-ribbon protein